MKVLTQDHAGQLSLAGCSNPIAGIYGFFIPILESSGHYIRMSLPAMASAFKLFTAPYRPLPFMVSMWQ